MGAVSVIWAPLHRALARIASPGAGFPLNAAPSLDFLASGIQDHRLPYNKRGSSAVQPGIVGWYGSASTPVANYVPSAIAVNNIAAAAAVASGVAMTLVAATGAGITVLSASAPALFFPTGLSLSAGRVIDGLPSLIMFGANGNFSTGFYNRSTYVGRCVSITGVASGTGGNFLVSGYDIYGFPMSQLITVAAGVNTVNSKKAFKAVTSVVPAFTDAGHTYSVGTADIFGFGIRADFFEATLMRYNGALITASTGVTVADTTSPATTTTGDVRGTYAVQSATDGVKRLALAVAPTLGAIVTNPTTGLFGVGQI